MSVVLKKVRNGDLVPPRAVNPLVPPALEAICLKAMQKEPGQRYQTASALADDVEFWLADEPVTAWSEPWTIRLRRWFRKHRTLVSTGVTTVILSVVLLTGFAARLRTENRKLSTALEFAYQQIFDVSNVILDSDMVLKSKSNSFRDMCQALQPYLDKLAEMARDTPFREEAASQREIVRLSLELNQNTSEKDEDFVRSIKAFRLAAEKQPQPAWKNIFLGLSYLFEAQRDQRLGKIHEARTQFITAFELFRKSADTETVAGRKAIELGTATVSFIQQITDKHNPSAWQAFQNCRDLMLDAMSEVKPNARNISGLDRLLCLKVFLELQRVSETPSDSIAIRLAADSAMQALQTIPESWRHHYAFLRARANATYLLSMLLLQEGKQKEAWDGMCRACDDTYASFESTGGTFADLEEADRRFVRDCELVVAMLGMEYILVLQKNPAVDHATIRTMAERSILAIGRIELLENAVAMEFREPLMNATLQPAVRFFEELQRELGAKPEAVSPVAKPLLQPSIPESFDLEKLLNPEDRQRRENNQGK
jgi:tetratricopeptide (TPR) repeat protein